MGADRDILAAEEERSLSVGRKGCYPNEAELAASSTLPLYLVSITHHPILPPPKKSNCNNIVFFWWKKIFGMLEKFDG